MFPFWDVAVAPVLHAADARRVVEVGALRGETTRLVVDHLGPDGELHVIDPLPDFDPAEHERAFPGRYVFHRALSLDVLGDLPPMDAALIDGDHNWYTVVNELRLLRRVARDAGAPLPLLVLHDVGWPYGRRDLYYDPDTIPAEHRQDWRRAGMEPGKVRLVPYGAGLNPTLANAKAEGGRRNGVRTALEDFLGEHDRPTRTVVLPIYFGLAIVAEEERLARQPALAAVLDHLESPAGKDELLELSERIRLDGLMFQHKVFYDREAAVDRVARRYLRELRTALTRDDAPSGGLDAVDAGLRAIEDDHVVGDVVCCGVDRPEAATYAVAALDAYARRRRLWVLTDGPEAAGYHRLEDVLDHHGLPRGRVTRVSGDDPAELPASVALLLVGPSGPATDTQLLGELVGRLSHAAQVVVDGEVPPEVRAVVDAHGTPIDAGPGAAARWQVTPLVATGAAS